MKIVNERYDEEAHEYVFELEVTDEERKVLDEIIHKYGYLSIDELLASVVNDFVNNPEKYKTWFNQMKEKCDVD